MRVGRSNLIEIKEINPSTGEVLATGTKFKKFENFVPNKGYLYKPQEHYIRMFAGTPLPRDMSQQDAYWMYRLAVHLENETNRLYVSRSRKNYPMTLRTMAEYLEIGYHKCAKFVERMMARHILARVTTAKGRCGGKFKCEYYVNPLYFFRGKWLSYQLYLTFQDELDKVLPKWVQFRFAESHRSIDEIAETEGIGSVKDSPANYIETDTGLALSAPANRAVHGEGDVEPGSAGCGEGTLS